MKKNALCNTGQLMRVYACWLAFLSTFFDYRWIIILKNTIVPKNNGSRYGFRTFQKKKTHNTFLKIEKAVNSDFKSRSKRYETVVLCQRSIWQLIQFAAHGPISVYRLLLLY